MSESQSRYSIVERLTRTKLDIMTAKSKLSKNPTGAELQGINMNGLFTPAMV